MAAMAFPARPSALMPLFHRFTAPASSSILRTLGFPLLSISRSQQWLGAIPAIPAISLNLPSIPSILEGIWEGILRAVPKKKTSHMKKRSRQMAGKALKDVNSLCKCPACGGVKRMHYVCEGCRQQLSGVMRSIEKEKQAAAKTAATTATST